MEPESNPPINISPNGVTPKTWENSNWKERSEMYLNDARNYGSIATQGVAMAMSRHSQKIPLQVKFATTITEDLAAAQVYATLANMFMQGALYCFNRSYNEYETPVPPTLEYEEVFRETPEAADAEG